MLHLRHFRLEPRVEICRLALSLPPLGLALSLLRQQRSLAFRGGTEASFAITRAVKKKGSKAVTFTSANDDTITVAEFLEFEFSLSFRSSLSHSRESSASTSSSTGSVCAVRTTCTFKRVHRSAKTSHTRQEGLVDAFVLDLLRAAGGAEATPWRHLGAAGAVQNLVVGVHVAALAMTIGVG